MKRRILVFTALVMGMIFALFPFGESLATLLRIERTGDHIQVYWPTGAIGYVLERKLDLTSTQWVEVTATPAMTNGEFRVTEDLQDTMRFYRLRAPSGTDPIIANVTAPSSLTFQESGSIDFEFNDPDCDVVIVDLTVSNEFETVSASLPADLVALNGTHGTFSMPIEGEDFPFGTNVFTVQLVDTEGRRSQVVTFTTVIAGDGSGGSAPVIGTFSSSFSNVRRPTGSGDVFHPLFSFNYTDADGDIERLRVTITHPGGYEEKIEASATSPCALISWARRHPPSPALIRPAARRARRSPCPGVALIFVMSAATPFFWPTSRLR